MGNTYCKKKMWEREWDVGMDSGAHPGMCAWNVRMASGVHFQEQSIGVLRQGFWLAWKSLIRVGLLGPGSPRDPPVSSSLVLELQVWVSNAYFPMWYLRITLRSSSWHLPTQHLPATRNTILMKQLLLEIILRYRGETELVSPYSVFPIL